MRSGFATHEFWTPSFRAPTCFNPQAARSVLPDLLRRTDLALTGLSKVEIMARIDDATKRKEQEPLEPGAMAYVLSKEQSIGDPDPHASRT